MVEISPCVGPHHQRQLTTDPLRCRVVGGEASWTRGHGAVTFARRKTGSEKTKEGRLFSTGAGLKTSREMAQTGAVGNFNAPPPPPPQSSCYRHWSAYIVGRLESSTLYPHQRDALNAIRNFWTTGRGSEDPNLPCVVCLPTGAGKSAIAAVAPYVLKASRVLVICPSKQTTAQLAENLSNGQPLDGTKSILKLGLATVDDARRSDGPLPNTLASSSVQTRHLNDDLGNQELVVTNAHKFSSTAPGGAAAPRWVRMRTDLFDVVIVDEAHHFPAGFWTTALTHFSSSKVLFLTATPFRSDGQLVMTAGEPAFILSREGAVNERIIRRVEQSYIDNNVDSEAAAWEETITRVRNLLSDQPPLPDGRLHKAMACASSTNNADRIVKIANANGLRAAVYASTVANKSASLNSFRSNDPGSIKLLVICNMLLEGFDHAPVSIVAIMNRVSSAVKFSQFVGRAVRIVRDADGVPDNVQAFCVHHKFFQQMGMFEAYDADRLVEGEVNRAETAFVTSQIVEDDNGGSDASADALNIALGLHSTDDGSNTLV